VSAGLGLTLVAHPLVQDRLARLRNADAPSAAFRRALGEAGRLIGYEALRGLPLRPIAGAAPGGRTAAGELLALPVCIVSVLRAGNGLVPGLLDLLPEAAIGYFGLARDKATLRPLEYYYRVQGRLSDYRVIVADPTLATDGSAIAAAARLKASGARDLALVTIVVALPGIAAFNAAHADVPVYAAACDPALDTLGYIVPGIGDAGDRLCGTP